MEHTEFLVIGAGPYSLATAAYAMYRGADVTVIGKTLDLWKTHMPRGMFLRSGLDWHLDARDVATFEAYVKMRGLTREQTKPIPRDTFLDYASWFMGQYDVTPRYAHVTHLARANGKYTAMLDDGAELTADSVLLGLGFAWFKHYPPDVVGKLPAGSYTHTSDTVDFDFFRDKRVLIVGGRQSAFETAALMREHGAQEIYVSHRHETPRFEEPNWDWVQPMARRTLDDHGWWRRLTPEEKEKIRQDFWAAGRLCLEAWLGPRVHQPNIHIHARTTVASVVQIMGADARREKMYEVTLSDGSAFTVHQIVLATGYVPKMERVTFLDRATILNELTQEDGFPALGTEFQTNLPNLYVTGLAATRDFGPFFGFTVACPVASRIIGEHVQP